jgi:hypothetical protein
MSDANADDVGNDSFEGADQRVLQEQDQLLHAVRSQHRPPDRSEFAVQHGLHRIGGMSSADGPQRESRQPGALPQPEPAVELSSRVLRPAAHSRRTSSSPAPTERWWTEPAVPSPTRSAGVEIKTQRRPVPPHTLSHGAARPQNTLSVAAPVNRSCPAGPWESSRWPYSGPRRFP